MDKWKQTRKKYTIIEMMGIVCITICFFIGALLDWNVIVKNNILIFVEDISSFSLTILQIQATIATLTIAIIALISGSITDSHMGVSISDFYLNIKPRILKQKILIFLSLALCLLATIAYLFKLYNIVFYLFIATIIAVSISIIEIYSAFKGKNVENKEIEAYIDYVLESNTDLNNKATICQNFVDDWKKIVSLQERQSYEQYFEVFRKCIYKIVDYEIDDGLKVIKEQSYSMAYTLLNSEKNLMKENGIEFVENVYETLWSTILENITVNSTYMSKYSNGFFLFSDIYSDLINGFQDLSSEKVEKIVKFENVSDLVLRVDLWLIYNKYNMSVNSNAMKGVTYEIDQLCFFSRSLGYYLGKQGRKGEIINSAIWTRPLYNWSIFSVYNVPMKLSNEFLEAKLKIYFNYCYGMILHGQENIVLQGLYLAGMDMVVSLENHYQALLYLMVHCYIYYLSERECDDCVSKEVRNATNSIINNKKVKASFENFINMLVEHAEWLNPNVPKKICEILDRYELFPKFGSVKTMIMENVVSDFYLFLILFISHEYYMPELLEVNIDDKEAFRYVSEGNERKTKELFVKLFQIIFSGKKSIEQIEGEVALMYDSLEKTVMKKQKERYIELAKKEQNTYESIVDEKAICEKIKQIATDKINDKFKDILVENDTKNGTIRIKLLTIDEYTSSLSKKRVDGYYSYMDGMFLFGVEKFLYDNNHLEVKNRFNDFSDDKDFLNYLQANELKILLGSQYILKNKDYRVTAEYKEFLNDYNVIYTSVVKEAMAIRKESIKVCLHDVNVSIHSPQIKESGAEYDDKTGKYKYSILSGLPIDFDADELSEFLYNNRKIINVTAKISVQVNEKIVGTLFTGKRGI